MLISITASKGYKRQHVGTYADSATAQRVIDNITDFAGVGWEVENVVESKRIGVYNARLT